MRIWLDDALGHRLRSMSVETASQPQKISLPENLPDGLYILGVLLPDGKGQLIRVALFR
ncbi:MAG: hypothetical protein R2791_20175 [Saprospiraceae bacterium]|nr:hypothetical protein [Saprospiraceae bacterium]MCB0544107.1 hypothetical protein [Saprospiraceae bacterium]MCB9356627.1 hypothetical protein [Lewinellaceae bacterium]